MRVVFVEPKGRCLWKETAVVRTNVTDDGWRVFACVGFPIEFLSIDIDEGRITVNDRGFATARIPLC